MKKVLLVASLAVALATPVWAQNPAPAPVAPPARPAQAPPPAPAAQPAPAPPAAPAASRPRQARPATPARAPVAVAVPAPPPVPGSGATPRNVKFDITITDTAGGKPITKALSVTVSNYSGTGSIRSTGVRPDGTPVPLNVDIRNVTWHSDTVVRASVNVEYQAYVPDAKPQPGLMTASSNSVFEDGRRTQILQTADPTSDRRTTIEVTATILK
ncbi:MAG TPA: hypothetical protein VFO21_03865 [Vicinamibacterales bacterium]|nr:hypothetical protein [Vicinamibacterales bacterium]